MARFRYSKFVPSLANEVDLEQLLEQLKDFFFDSGFYSQFYPQGDPSLADLHRALAEILSANELLPESWRESLKKFAEDQANELTQEIQNLLDRILERLTEEGYLQVQSDEGSGQYPSSDAGSTGDAAVTVKFELTSKGIDFLGYKTLGELLSSLGHSSFGSHETDQLATGVQADAPSKTYEFGDTLNLDISETLLNSVRRAGLQIPLSLEYSDLMVYQTDYQSSCATVLMLDCSHSMILYGEDRFTPAKNVALGLAHLIRSRFPGDSLHIVLFHDSAQEIPLVKLPSVKIGPYHTNTCEGLRLSRRILLNQKKEMRQIIMITDGKPSAITLSDGRIYKNPFGLDPLILRQTFAEVANCRNSGILINTFMLARDYYLVEFIKRVSQICRGKAYFTSTLNLGDYLLMDFMTKKARSIH